MNKVAWQRCHDPIRMLQSLDGHRSDRKFRLFATAACRLRPELTRSRKARDVMTWSECLADDAPFQPGVGEQRAELAVVFNLYEEEAAVCAQRVAGDLVDRYGVGMEQELVTLIRDVFGDDPLKPFHFRPEWRTVDVRNLAQVAYKQRLDARRGHLREGSMEPDALGCLHDALVDARCDSDHI